MLLEALYFMFRAKVCLLIFSFKNCVKLTEYPKVTSRSLSKTQLILVKKAISRANYFAFWKNVCLVQSISARWMLNRRQVKSELKLGVTHDKHKKIIAHAWINVQNIEIVNKGSDYTELISF